MTLQFDHELRVAQWGVVIGASLVAALLDMRTRRVPNWLTLPLLASGLVASVILGGLAGLGSAIAACGLLALPYVILFVVGGGGAGDAKMMGALGAWLGLEAGVPVLVCVAGIGGVLGLLRMVSHRNRWTLLGNLLTSLYILVAALFMGRSGWSLMKSQFAEPEQVRRTGVTIPYAPAIFLGVCLGAFVVHTWR